MIARAIVFAVALACTASVFAAGPVTTDATFLEAPQAPRYPASAIKEKNSGTVRVAVSIDNAGQVVAVDLSQTSGSAVLDAVAIERAWNWKFKPATEDGQPVESRVVVPVVFSLDGPSEPAEALPPAAAEAAVTSAGQS